MTTAKADAAFNADLQTLNTAARAKVMDLKLGQHLLNFKFRGTAVQTKLNLVADAQALIITFHGAIDPAKTKPPVFLAFDGLPAHQLSLCDPSLAVHPGLRVGWFAGHKGFDTQRILAALIRGVVWGLQQPRLIFFGASSGGFAALNFSHGFPDSIVVAGNPQVRIANYFKRLVDAYRNQCWPDVASNDELETVTRADLMPLYSRRIRNTVVYLQAMGDRFHATDQMYPFLGAIAGSPDRAKVLVHSEFDGVMGHASKPELYRRWLQAACASPSTAASDLLATWHELNTLPEAAASGQHQPGSAAGADPRAPALRDIALADRLASVLAAP